MLTGAIGMIIDYSVYLNAVLKTKWQLSQLDAESDSDEEDADEFDDEHVESAVSKRRGALMLDRSSISLANLYNLSTHQRYWNDCMGIPAFAVPIIQELLVSAALIVVNMGVGTLFYSLVVDDLTPVNAIYLAAVTVTTVGYGDVVPTNRASRIFTIFYAVFGTLLTAKAMATLNSAMDKYKKACEDNEILVSKMTIGDLINMDVDNDGGVSKAEYMIYKVIHMNLVDPEVIERIEKQFECVDVNGDGEITVDEIQGTYPKMFVRPRTKTVAPHPSRVLPMNRASSNASEVSLSGRVKEIASAFMAHFTPRAHSHTHKYNDGDGRSNNRHFFGEDNSPSISRSHKYRPQADVEEGSRRHGTSGRFTRLARAASTCDDAKSLRSNADQMRGDADLASPEKSISRKTRDRDSNCFKPAEAWMETEEEFLGCGIGYPAESREAKSPIQGTAKLSGFQKRFEHTRSPDMTESGLKDGGTVVEEL